MLFFILFAFILGTNANSTIIINGNTGVIHSSHFPTIAKKGDNILFCPIHPPISSICQTYDLKLGKCFISNNFCYSTKFNKNISPGSIFQTNGWQNNMIPSTSQPNLNPSIHCLILSKGNGFFWQTCMKYLKLFTFTGNFKQKPDSTLTFDKDNPTGLVHKINEDGNYTKFETKIIINNKYEGGTIIVGKNETLLTKDIIVIEMTYYYFL